LDVELQEVYPGRSNLLARLSPQGPVRQRILLAPHLDTVDVADEISTHAAREAGRLYGRGACDTKGAAAAMNGGGVRTSAHQGALRRHGDHFCGIGG